MYACTQKLKLNVIYTKLMHGKDLSRCVQRMCTWTERTKWNNGHYRSIIHCSRSIYSGLQVSCLKEIYRQWTAGDVTV